MKEWQQLSTDDFSIQNPDWIPSLQATVQFDGVEMNLAIDDAKVADQPLVDCFIELINGWQKRLAVIAAQTEDYLQHFLPGRTIKPSELALSIVSVDTNDGNATAGTFHYHVTGEFDDPEYKLDEFGHRSVVELQFPIQNNAVDWTAGDIWATNDFD